MKPDTNQVAAMTDFRDVVKRYRVEKNVERYGQLDVR